MHILRLYIAYQNFHFVDFDNFLSILKLEGNHMHYADNQQWLCKDYKWDADFGIGSNKWLVTKKN